MIGIAKIWNYLYYLTWNLLQVLGKVLIERPLAYVFSFIPFLRKNWKKGKKGYDSFVNGRELSINMAYAFAFMFVTTALIYATICIYVVRLFEIKDDNNLHYYFIGILSMAYLTNYLLLWRSDKYKKYFKEFDKTTIVKMNYLYIVLFHLGITTFFILSIYWIVGFNL